MLEANGIATVIIGSAIVIVEHCGVPRYLHNDLPLGNPLGHPYHPAEHLDSVRHGLQMVRDSPEPIVTVSSLEWKGGDAWRQNYMRVDETNLDALRRMGDENRQRRRGLIDAGLKRD